MQDFVPLIGVVVVFVGLFVFLGRKRPPRPRSRYARWNSRSKR